MDPASKYEESSDGGERVIIEEQEVPDDDAEAAYLKEGEYNVEKIVDVKKINGRKHYQVKWEGFPSSQNTWEPVEHLQSVQVMVDAFEREYAQKSKLKPEPPKLLNRRVSGSENKVKENKSDKRKSAYPLVEDFNTKKIKPSKPETVEEELVITLDQSDSQEKNSSTEFEDSENGPSIQRKKETRTKSDKKSSDKAHKTIKVSSNQKKSIQVVKKKDKVGSFKNKDKPKEILGIKPGKDGEFYFLIEWEMRSDGIKPENSHVSNAEFRTNETNFLLDFYESKIVIFAKKKKAGEQTAPLEKEAQEETLNELIQNVRKPSITDSKEKEPNEEQEFVSNLNNESELKQNQNVKEIPANEKKDIPEMFYPLELDENEEKINNRALEDMERDLEDQAFKFMSDFDGF